MVLGLSSTLTTYVPYRLFASVVYTSPPFMFIVKVPLVMVLL